MTNNKYFHYNKIFTLFIIITIYSQTLLASDLQKGILVWFYSIETKEDIDKAYIHKFTQSAGVNYESNIIHNIGAINPQSKVSKYKDQNWYLNLSSTKQIVTNKQPLFLGQILEIDLIKNTKYQFIPIKYNIPINDIKYKMDLSKYLVDRVDLQINSKYIKNIKNNLLKNNKNILDYITSVNVYIQNNLKYIKIKRPNNTLDILKAKKGWCGEYTKVKLALLRSAGVAARDVYASSINKNDLNDISKIHTWIQAYVPEYGWISVPSTKKTYNKYQFAILRSGYYLRAFDLYKYKKYIQKKVYSRKLLKSIGPTRGNGMFFNIDTKYYTQIKSTINEILDVNLNQSNTIFAKIKQLPNEIKPLLYWFLISTPKQKIHNKATKEFIHSLNQQEKFNFDTFYKISPSLVKKRIMYTLSNHL